MVATALHLLAPLALPTLAGACAGAAVWLGFLALVATAKAQASRRDHLARRMLSL